MEQEEKTTNPESIDKVTELIVKEISQAKDQIKEGISEAIDEKLKPIQEEQNKILSVSVKDDRTLAETVFGVKEKGFSTFFVEVAKSKQGLSSKLKEYAEKSSTGFIDKAAGTPSHSVSDGALGGFLVPKEYSNQLIKGGIEASNFMNMIDMMPVSTDSIELNVIDNYDHSGGAVYGNVIMLWKKELGEFVAKNLKIENIELTLQKLTGLAYASNELLTDSPTSIQSLITESFGRAWAFAMDSTIMEGSGAGQPLGILDAANGSLLTIPKENAQDANTLLYENIINMYSRQMDKGSAVWVLNDTVFPQLGQMAIVGGTSSTPIYMPPMGASEAPFGTIFGRPVIFTEHVPALGNAGDINFISFKHYQMIQKAGSSGLKSDTSIHVKFLEDQTAFRFVWRTAGQPKWRTYFTPKYGSTISPFITLEARS